MTNKNLNDLVDLAQEYQKEITRFHPSGDETTYLLRKLIFFIIKAWILTVFIFLSRN